MLEALRHHAGVGSVELHASGDAGQSATQLLVAGDGSGDDLRVAVFRAAVKADAPILELRNYAPIEEVFKNLTQPSASATTGLPGAQPGAEA
jgi:hypothetical protein